MIDYNQMVQDVIEGNESPFRSLGIIQMEIKELQKMEAILKDAALDEAQKHDKKFYDGGFDIERREGGRIWNFKEIPEWNKAKDTLNAVETKYKALADAYGKFDGVQVADADGCEITLPKVTYRKDSLIIKPAEGIGHP